MYITSNFLIATCYITMFRNTKIENIAVINGSFQNMPPAKAWFYSEF